MTVIDDLNLTQTILTRYILLLCFIFGLAGSFFNLFVFCQKKLRSNSCSVYFIGTSIFNVLVILSGIIPVLLTSYLPNDPTLNSRAFCKARSYTIHIFLMMSRSSVALACLDRFALCSPNPHIRRLNKRCIAIMLLIIESIVWILIPIHVLVYIDIQMPGPRCGAIGVYSIVYSIYAPIVTCIPLGAMLFFSFWALQNLRHIHARIRPDGINTMARIRKRDAQLMTILIGEVVVYFFSTVWYPIYSIYVTITLNTPKSPVRTAIEGLVRYLTLNFLIFFNSCSLFYVHLLTSKAFRKECRHLIRRVFNRHNQVANRISHATPDVSNTRKQLNPTSGHLRTQIHPNNNIRMNSLY